MKGLFIGSGVVAAVAYAVLTWSPAVTNTPIIPPHVPSSAVVQPAALPVPDPVLPAAELPRPTPEAVLQAQQPTQVEMPAPAVLPDPGSAKPAKPMPSTRRPSRPASNQIGQVNRPVANSFTAELNRQEMQSLEAGGRASASAPWRELGPNH
jgi:hypothetical protein